MRPADPSGFLLESAFVFIHGGGWVHYVQGPARAWVRFEKDDGRLTAVELHVAARGASTLRSLLNRLGLPKLEALINRASIATQIEQCWSDEHPDTSDLQTWDIIDSPHRGGQLVKVPHQHVNAVVAVPEGSKYGRDFYAQIAEVYDRLVQVTRSPAALLAEANDVPVTTAHRWIRQARKNGFLPPGKPGRAG